MRLKAAASLKRTASQVSTNPAGQQPHQHVDPCQLLCLPA